jgi:hypothetical protein
MCRTIRDNGRETVLIARIGAVQLSRILRLGPQQIARYGKAIPGWPHARFSIQMQLLCRPISAPGTQSSGGDLEQNNSSQAYFNILQPNKRYWSVGQVNGSTPIRLQNVLDQRAQ